MGKDTHIEWATHSWNPWEGCTKVSAGCANCYAENRNARFGGGTAPNWGKGAPRRRTSEANWREPLKWNREAERTGTRPRVFCASLADVFDEEVALEWLRDVLMLIQETPHLDWLVLTKRPENVIARLKEINDHPSNFWPLMLRHWMQGHAPANVWLGTSVENQASADKRIPELLKIPAKVRFLSCEPLLGPVEFSDVTRRSDAVKVLGQPALSGIHWVICGGESGPNARPMHPDWARSLRNQCNAAKVAFHFKQHGEWLHHSQTPCDEQYPQCVNQGFAPVNGFPEKSCFQHSSDILDLSYKCGKKAAGRLLDGRTWDELPEVIS